MGKRLKLRFGRPGQDPGLTVVGLVGHVKQSTLADERALVPGAFKQVGGNMHFVFNGTVNGFKVNFNIQAEHRSSTQFDFVFDCTE